MGCNGYVLRRESLCRLRVGPKCEKLRSSKRASASRRSGKWSDDDYDALADCVVVGRIMKAAAKPADAS